MLFLLFNSYFSDVKRFLTYIIRCIVNFLMTFSRYIPKTISNATIEKFFLFAVVFLLTRLETAVAGALNFQVLRNSVQCHPETHFCKLFKSCSVDEARVSRRCCKNMLFLLLCISWRNQNNFSDTIQES